MSQKPRNTLLHDGCYFHVTWQCHNQDWHLREEWTKCCYYDLLWRYHERYGVTVHAYHLMENHIHLIGRLTTVKAFSDLFRTINNLFARYVNRKHQRRGQMVMDRFRSPLIEDDRYLLTAMAYSDLNGVRAGRDRTPEESLWSSYRFYAYGKEDDLLIHAPSYLALAADPKSRRRIYREMVRAMACMNEAKRIV